MTTKEHVYEDISKACKMENAKYAVVAVDLNAKIGTRIQGDSENIGNIGLGIKNSRGEMLLNFLTKENLYCLNTFFKNRNGPGKPRSYH